jgi:hypothetical protein
VSPAWSYCTEQVPVPLVIVNVEPAREHTPVFESVTGLPDPPPFAATEKLEPKAAPDGACDDTEIVWLNFVAVTDSTTCGASSYSVLPAWSYFTEHVPVPVVIVNSGPTFVQAPALENVTELPEPPPVAATEKLEPNAAFAGACVDTEIV